MKKIVLILLLVLTSIFPLENAYSAGSGAFRLEAPDAEALGKGLAFVAQADNPSAVYFNPAGLTQLKDKTYVSLGAAAIQPFGSYKDNSGNQTERRKQVFTIPNFFVVSDLGLEKFSFGVGGTSYWGLGTHWSEDSFSKYVSTKSDYRTEDIMFAGAYELNDNISIGIAADYTKSYVNKKKKLNNALFLGAGDGDFQLKGKDNSAWGYRLSTLYKFNPKHSFGFMYRSPVDVKYKGKVYMDNLNGIGYTLNNFGTSYETEITSKTTLPQSVVMGYCYKPNENLRLEFDAEWMDWSSIQEEKIDFPSETDPNRLAVLNDGNPIPKDWHSTFSFSLGSEYKLNDILKLRMGYIFHKTPIPQANFETSLPDASSHAITLGTGINLKKNITLDFAYAGMLYDKRKISNNKGAASGASINGEYKQFISIYLLTLTFKI